MEGHGAVNCRRLEGRLVVVTASTQGIGLGIAERLGLEGAKVVICSRKQRAVDDALDELRAKGVDCAGTVCHVGDPAQIQALVERARSAYPGLPVHALVSNAAVNPAVGGILDMDERAIDKILDMNIKSAILVAKAFVPHMAPGSSIVFVSSIAAFKPGLPLGLYGVSKTALLGLVKALAEELGPRGIRVNGLCPGLVPTKFAAALLPSDRGQKRPEDLTREEVMRINPGNLVGRLGRPSDQAACVAYLVSDDAAYVTGENMVVAGGVQSRL